MVVVEPRHHHSQVKNSFFRRHSCSGAFGNSGVSSVDKMKPAVDFPVQLNFGSPYSSSLTIFFDFDMEEGVHPVDRLETARKTKDRRLVTAKSFNLNRKNYM